MDSLLWKQKPALTVAGKRHVLALAFLFLALAPKLSARDTDKSHEECLKLVPGDWGPNFGAEWHEHEAIYWGCRLGVSADIVKAWQRAANIDGMVQDARIASIEGQQFVFIEEMEGSAHCYNFSALKKTSKGWENVWERASPRDTMDYCTLRCPPIKMKVHGKFLILEFPSTTDPNEDISVSCRKLAWRKERFLWDWKTFEPVKNPA